MSLGIGVRVSTAVCRAGDAPTWHLLEVVRRSSDRREITDQTWLIEMVRSSTAAAPLGE